MITILIATYNSQATLRDCLDSVLAQSYQDWECVICDGISTDNTIQIIEEYEFQDSRFRHNIQKDTGIYDALNNGIKIAKGEWIYVLGSDDRLHSDAFSNFMSIQNDKYDVIYGDIIVEYINGIHRLIPPDKLSNVRYYMPISHQGVIMKTNRVRAIGAFDLKYKVKGDFNMTLTLYLQGCKFLYVQTPVAYCGMTGLSNQIGAMIKYDWERLQITRSKKSNRCPLFFFWLVEIKSILITLRDKILKRK